ncbi:MAG: family 43 glycosylhydrolase [Fibrobacteraceae bacterium]|nr:family 43 glycosylhydrolase [Fibrobacteraceae bacterium]
MKNKILSLTLAAGFAVSALAATVSNPLIWSDVPDPCIARGEGDNYYMVSTTMHYAPGVPIMKSTDLANWRTVNYAYETLINNNKMNLNGGENAYGKGSWASGIRYHKGKWYILTPSYTSNNTHLYITDDIENGPFEEKKLPFYHDPSIFFDDDGSAYVVYGGGQLSIVKLKADLSGPDGGSTVLVSEDTRNKASGTSSYIVALEGAHMEKVDGKYYLFGISWFGPCRTELVFRSDNLMSGFSGKIFLQDNGVAQGSIFSTAAGKWYAYLFRDSGGVGRIPWLMEVEWKDGWPTVVGGKAPSTLNLENPVNPGYNMVTSDEFDGPNLPLEWQWNHNPDNSKWALADGKLKITTGRVDNKLIDAKNTLTQRTYGPTCSGRTLVSGKGMKDGDFAGLVALADSLGFVALEKTSGGFNVVYYERTIRLASEPLSGDEAYFRIDFNFQNQADRAKFYYSTDGKSWKQIGKELKLPYTLGMFVGYRFGLFNFATKTAGGYAEFDWFKVGDDFEDEIYLDGVAKDTIPQTPYKDVAFKIPGKIEMENYDVGGQKNAYYDSDSENQGDAKFREDERVDVVLVDENDASKGMAIGYTAEGEWVEYTVDVTEAGKYFVYANVASGADASGFSVSIDGAKVADFTGISTGDWQTYEQVKSADQVSVTAGSHVVRIDITGANVNIDWISFGDTTSKIGNLASVVPQRGAMKVFNLQGMYMGTVKGVDLQQEVFDLTHNNGLYILKGHNQVLKLNVNK